MGGIKRIFWRKSSGDAKAERKGDKILMEAGESYVTFGVEWLPNTTVEEKKLGVFWRILNQDKSPNSEGVHTAYNQDYAARITKPFAGESIFYIEARNGKSVATIPLQGSTDPKIIKTEWRVKGGNKDLRYSQFKFNQNVIFYAETEGLNGCFVDVEIFWMNSKITIEKIAALINRDFIDPLNDDGNYRVFKNKVFVNQGFINGEFTPIANKSFIDTKEENRFYVRVKYNGKDVLDKERKPSVIHGRFLRVKGEAEHYGIKPLEDIITVKPVLVGDASKNTSAIHSCTFEKIEVVDNLLPYTIFNLGSFSQYFKPGGYHDFILDIHYDYDKFNIRNDAKEVLNKVASYLLDGNAFIPVEIGSHADERGTDNYNFILTQNRAQAAVDYLIAKGVKKELIKAVGYGKSKPIVKNASTEEEHQKNRRSTLKFLVEENQAKPIIIDVIAPDFEARKKKEIQLKIDKWTDKGCTRKHPKTVRIREGLGGRSTYNLKKDGLTIINQEVHSLKAELVNLIIETAGMGYNNTYKAALNTCAYYSNPKQDTIYINAFTDAVFSYNFSYGIPENNRAFFNDIKLPLYAGTPKLDQFIKEMYAYTTAFNPFGEYQRVIFEALYDTFIADETRKVATGYFTLANFANNKERKQPEKIENYLQKHYVLAEIQNIIIFAAIEFLIILITRGTKYLAQLQKIKNAKKIEKLEQYTKFLKDNGFSIITPKVSTYRVAYLDVNKGGMNRVYKERVKADPLLGIDFKQEFNLVDLSEQNKSLDKLYKKYAGNNITAFISFSSNITLDYELKINLSTRQFKLTNNEKGLPKNLIETITKSNVSITPGAKIIGTAEVKIDGKVEKDIDFIPFVNPVKYKVTINAKAEIGGYIAFTRKFSMDNIPFVEDEIYFSGIKGKIKLPIDTETKERDKGWEKVESASGELNHEFTLFNEKRWTFKKIALMI